MKKIKYLSFIILTVISFLCLTLNVNAASATISVTSSSSKIVVGKTFKVTVKVSSAVTLGAWEYTLNYDSSMVSLVSSDVSLHYAGYGDGSVKSKSYSYTFKALKSGNAKFNVVNTSVIGWDESTLSVSNGSRTVQLITQAELEASYSSNNNLSGLSVTGYELSPVFDKETLAYSVNVPSEITKITIDANKEDKTASVAGTGEFEVTEGLNTFEIKVTAQNGNVKTYTLNVNVEDKNPIVALVDGENWTVIKRKDLLTMPSTYKETIVKINEIDVPAFTSDVTKYVLVGMKNEAGEVKLFIYNEKEKIYTRYVELTLNSLIFYPISNKEKFKDYIETKVTINEEKVIAYKFDLDSPFAIIYGKNIETGEEGFYSYDEEENTLQRINMEEVESLKKDLKDYMQITYVFAGGLFLALIIIIVLAIKSSKRKNKKSKKLKVNEIIEEKIEEVKEDKKEDLTEEKKSKKKKK